MTRFVYVRHGESNSTVARVIGGYRTCRGLSPLGVRQAEALRDRWLAAPELAPDLLVSSEFPRARQTAEIFAPALGGVGRSWSSRASTSTTRVTRATG